MNRLINKIFYIYKKIFWTPEKIARNSGVQIGKDCDIQDVCFGSEPYLIRIGNHVQITSGTKIFTHGGGWILRQKYPDMDFFGRIEIKDNVYIGNNVLIMPGVTIGSNVLIAAGSVVTKSISDGSIVAGNPAKKISSFEDFETRCQQLNVKTKAMSKHEKEKYLLSLPDDAFIRK